MVEKKPFELQFDWIGLTSNIFFCKGKYVICILVLKATTFASTALIDCTQIPYVLLNDDSKQPYHHSSGKRVGWKVYDQSHFHSLRTKKWTPTATKIMFDRPCGTLCAFEMATPPSDHIIIGRIVAVSERPGKFLIILISHYVAAGYHPQCE